MQDSSKLELEIDGMLLARWRDGDQQAVNELLALVLPWLHSVVSRALGNQPRGAHDSMDHAQNAVMNFLRRGIRFVPATPAQFLGLMKRIAINQLKDHWRRQKRAGRERHWGSLVNSANPLSDFGADSDSSNAPRRQAEQSEERQWVRLAMQFLSDDDRWVLSAGDGEEIGWAAVAAELGVTEDAARVRANRARPKLANLLRKLRAGHMPADA